MIVKLIEAGGFAGLKKTAEEDLSAYPDAVKEAVKKVFDAPPKATPRSPVRDKEQRFLEWDGKVVPLADVKADKALQDLLKRLQKNLSP